MVAFNLVNYISTVKLADKRVIIISKYKLAFNSR